MILGKGIFAVKLYELEKQYSLLQSRLQLCQQYDRNKLSLAIELLKDECSASDIMLEKHVRESQSPYAAKLAKAQLIYRQQIESIVRCVLSEDHSSESRAEALTLHAEFAIDFAAQAMNEALLAAMYAVDAQLINEENKEAEQ